ncbi:hypothetical protein QE454_000133 [Microbacterium sp. SORGH_AS454]|nr:hypothetical protein [Microbacterium sp. SORGH_AS_0454]
MEANPAPSPACTVVGEKLLGQVVERLAMPLRQEPVLRSGEVEADHTAPAPRDRELGDVARVVVVAEGRQQLADTDVPPACVGGIFSLLDTFLHGVHDVVEAETAGEVLLGGPPHLAVDDAVGREVFDELPGRAYEALTGLHDADGHRELLEVILQRASVEVVREPRFEALRVVGGQVEPDLVGQLEHRLRAQPAVEVVVQRDLRQIGDLRPADAEFFGCHGVPLSGCHHAVMRSRTMGDAAGAVSPISRAPSTAPSARSKRDSSSADRVNSG